LNGSFKFSGFVSTFLISIFIAPAFCMAIVIKDASEIEIICTFKNDVIFADTKWIYATYRIYN
jgi:hypothetical protein